MLQLFRQNLLEVVKAIAPLIVVICGLQLTFVKAPASLFLRFLIGSLMALGGLVLFFTGIDIGILPMGRFIGSELLIITTAFLLGFVTTAAEPDVQVLSKRVDLISQGNTPGNAILYVTSVGVGVLCRNRDVANCFWVAHGIPACGCLFACHYFFLFRCRGIRPPGLCAHQR
jgi:hypothetical protein